MRHKWALIGLVALGAAGGVVAAGVVKPSYTAAGSILVSSEGADVARGPIRDDGMLEVKGWIDVLRSNRVVDSVVLKSRSHIGADEPDATALITSARTRTTYTPGAYVLTVDATGTGYKLSSTETKSVVETGALPDSVGKRIGMEWYVNRQPAGREVKFRLIRVRDAAQYLLEDLKAFAPEQAQFITVQLTAADPNRAAAVLNFWMDEVVTVASDLKRRRATDYMQILDSQLALAEERLRAAEVSLETLRTSTITSASVGGPISGGVEEAREPLLKEFFATRLSFDSVRKARESLEQMLRNPDGLSIDALQSLPEVMRSNDALRSAIAEIATKEGNLRTARQIYGDEHSSVKDLLQQLDALRRQTVPGLARGALDQLAYREQSLSKSVAGFTAEMRRIPVQTSEEARRRREVTVAEALYTSVLSRYNEARLGSAALGGDLSVFDYARPPRTPTVNNRRRVALVGVVIGMGLATLLVFWLARTDRLLRFAEQITADLRLDILGVIPLLQSKVRSRSAGQLAAAQSVEAFRTLRLRLQHELWRDRGFMVVFSSPGIGDGKSHVATNVALSCAEAGLRTLLVDGDVRLGKLHATFETAQSPGIVDVLAESTPLASAIVPTHVAGLDLLPCGTPDRRSPELLERGRLTPLLDELARDYEAVIVDSAPLGAGVDAFALGVAAGNLVLVVRKQHSDLRLASAKLAILDRLPVRVAGAVLNGAESTGDIEYDPSFTEYLLAGDSSAKRVGGSRVTPASSGSLTAGQPSR
jgi:capsular exopolysaccharide synthesis family protein